jgi:hypothetical protein
LIPHTEKTILASTNDEVCIALDGVYVASMPYSYLGIYAKIILLVWLRPKYNFAIPKRRHNPKFAF